MLTLTEIEKAVDSLTTEQKRELRRYLEQSFQTASGDAPANGSHGVLDIAAIRLGPLRPMNSDDDLLGEMLEEHP